MYNKEAIVALVRDNSTLVLNKGLVDGMEPGQRFQIFASGEEVTDPVTGESLGLLEIVKGTGKIMYVQERISILKTDMKTSPRRTIRRASTNPFDVFTSVLPTSSEEILPADPIAFDDPYVGDRARPI